MKTILYSHYRMDDHESNFPFFATLAEAKRSAQEEANDQGNPVEIERLETVELPLRELACRLLAGTRWCADNQVVYVCNPRLTSQK